MIDLLHILYPRVPPTSKMKEAESLKRGQKRSNPNLDPSCVFFSFLHKKMMLFSLHSIFAQPTTIQADNKLLKYVQKIKVCDFSIVDYFQYFGFKERHLANATFKELISAVLTHPKAEKHLIHFAESHYINDFAVSVTTKIYISVLKLMSFFRY